MKKKEVKTQADIQKNKRNVFPILLTWLLLAMSLTAAAKTQQGQGKASEFSAPKVVKSFNPPSITANDFVTMAIAFSNPNPETANFTAPFSDRLPSGVVILGSASTSCGGTLTAEPGGSKIILTDSRINANDVCQILVGVTSSKAGIFISKTEASALQTDKGSNLLSSAATLTVMKSVLMDLRIKKSFNPESIKLNEFTTLNITLSNPNNEMAKLAALFTDYLPEGMVILGAARTTCDGWLTANPGTPKITLSDVRIPANSTCEILLGVTALDPKSSISSEVGQIDGL